MKRRLTGLVSIAALLLQLSTITMARVAHADGKEDEQVARAQFIAGRSYYDQANYSDALKAFTEAHRLTKKPALLYNIALCQEHLQHLSEAVSTLQSYVALDGSDRAAVEARIANLKRQLKTVVEGEDVMQLPPSFEVAPPAPPQQQPMARPARKKTWVWGVVAGAAVAVGVGLGVGLTLGMPSSSGASFDSNLPKGGPGVHALTFTLTGTR